MKKYDEIQASLITSNGFHKMIKIPELKEIISIPILMKTRLSDIIGIGIDDPPTLPTYMKTDFRLERYKIEKQNKNAKIICFAVYEEI